ncbi:hypothetical protein ABPY43_11720 [Streptomyces sp. Mo3]
MPQHARRTAGFNQPILSLYTRGTSVRDIRSHLAGTHGQGVRSEGRGCHDLDDDAVRTAQPRSGGRVHHGVRPPREGALLDEPDRVDQRFDRLNTTWSQETCTESPTRPTRGATAEDQVGQAGL